MVLEYGRVYIVNKDVNKRADTSLRAKSLRRALDKEVPNTLTPYEWEQWYAEHGVPQSHKKRQSMPRRSWWRFWQD